MLFFFSEVSLYWFYPFSFIKNKFYDWWKWINLIFQNEETALDLRIALIPNLFNWEKEDQSKNINIEW
jgi:hypothetical protein